MSLDGGEVCGSSMKAKNEGCLFGYTMRNEVVCIIIFIIFYTYKLKLVSCHPQHQMHFHTFQTGKPLLLREQQSVEFHQDWDQEWEWSQRKQLHQLQSPFQHNKGLGSLLSFPSIEFCSILEKKWEKELFYWKLLIIVCIVL